jgi:hypothetical protein
MQLENNCVMGNLVYRGYEKEWMQKVNGFKKGASITAKAPLYFRVKDGETIDVVDLREEDISLTVNFRKHIAYKLSGTEMSLNIDAFSERYITPAMQAIGNYLDTVLLGLYTDIPNQVGTPGTTPSDYYTIASAAAVLADEACPQENRACVLDPWAQAKMADTLKGVFNPGMVGNILEKGKFGNLSGFDMYMSQNVNSHTCGTAAGATTALVDDTVAEGDTTINVDENGSWGLTFKKGDIFTIAGVNGVNPISGVSTGRLRQFVVNADVSDAGNDGDVTCTPGTAPWNIYSSAAGETYLPYQNIDALPANNAAVTTAGSSGLVHKVNMAFHKNALALFMVPVEAPSGLNAVSKNYKGFNVTVSRGSDIVNFVEYIRFDVLFGVKVINPFMACRIAG